MLSTFSRRLTYATALFYGALGAALFLLPGQLASVFAWKVSAFVTMTIGGWCLGNAWLAYISARRWQWRLVYPSLIYLWLFGLGQLIVLFVFRDKLKLEHPIAWMYLITLLLNFFTSVVGVFDWFRLHPSRAFDGQALRAGQRWPAFAFVLAVGFLGFYGMVAQPGMPGTNAGIFPESMSVFTLRSFGVFYFSLALGVVPIFWERNPDTVLHHAFAAYGLVFSLQLPLYFLSTFSISLRARADCTILARTLLLAFHCFLPFVDTEPARGCHKQLARQPEGGAAWQ